VSLQITELVHDDHGNINGADDDTNNAHDGVDAVLKLHEVLLELSAARILTALTISEKLRQGPIALQLFHPASSGFGCGTLETVFAMAPGILSCKRSNRGCFPSGATIENDPLSSASSFRLHCLRLGLAVSDSKVDEEAQLSAVTTIYWDTFPWKWLYFVF